MNFIKYFIVIIIITEINFCTAQSRDKATWLPARGKQGVWNINRDKIFTEHWFFISFGYHNSGFVNKIYGLNKKEGLIKDGIGTEFSLMKAIEPAIIDFNWFASRYDVDENAIGWSLPDIEYERVVNRGVGGGVLFCLVPKTKYFVPVIGISGQSSALVIRKKTTTQKQNGTGGTDSETKTTNIASLNTSAIMFRYGFFLVANPVNIKCEFKRSIYAANNFKINEISILLGYPSFD